MNFILYPMKLNINKRIDHLKIQLEKHLILFAFSFLFLACSNAQNISNTAYVTASATIVTETVGVEKLADIDFSGIQSGSENTLSGYSAVNIIGSSNAYSITIPSTSITVKKKGSNETMAIGSIKINSENTHNQIFTINAALNISHNQASGVYTSITPLMVIVNYN